MCITDEEMVSMAISSEISFQKNYEKDFSPYYRKKKEQGGRLYIIPKFEAAYEICERYIEKINESEIKTFNINSKSLIGKTRFPVRVQEFISSLIAERYQLNGKSIIAISERIREKIDGTYLGNKIIVIMDGVATIHHKENKKILEDISLEIRRIDNVSKSF